MFNDLRFAGTIACLLMFVSIDIYAQPDTLWTKTYGGSDYDRCGSLQQTSNGGYIIVGFTSSFGEGGTDAYLIKADSSGDTLWTKTYGGASYDYGESVQQTSDGKYIIAGGTESFGAGGSDVYLIKADSSGDTLWTKTYGGGNDDYGKSVQLTSDGGYIIAGRTESFGTGGSDVYLIKADSSGDTLWTKTYGGASHDYGWSVQLTSDGGYIITGYTYSFGAGSDDVYLIKTDSSGDTLWTKTYGGTNGDYGFSVQQTSDGGYIIAGYTYSLGAGGSDVYLIKADSSGDTLWTKTYGGEDTDYGYSVQQTSDGSYIITGSTWSFGTGYNDVYLIKADSSGDTLWTKTYGGEDTDYGYSVQQTSDGSYIIAGETKSFGAGFTDIYLIKTEQESGIEEYTPEPFPILQVSPNPCLGSVELEYSITNSSDVRIDIYNIIGRKVTTLENEHKEAGKYTVTWNGIDQSGIEVPGGVYLILLYTDNHTITGKVTVLR